MNQRLYINPDEALCPDCDGGQKASWRYSTCPTCGDCVTWATTIAELGKAAAKIEELETDAGKLRDRISEIEEQIRNMEAVA